MRILYLSCHSILEYEEVKLLHEMGHEVFSPGAYIDPGNPEANFMRPNIPGLVYNPDVLEQFHKIAGSVPGKDAKDYLTKEFVDNFDCVIVMHLPRWISGNWEAIRHKRVIWRTIGQSITNTEQALLPFRRQGIQVVRYSPRENTIPKYIGADALIRFYKDPHEYQGWSGQNRKIITFAQNMERRGSSCNFEFFEEVTRPFNRGLFGPGNEDSGDYAEGKIPFDQLKEELRNNRAYFYTGTHPASYTLNFMEAWMTGIPVVAIGPEHGNGNAFVNHDLYEVPYLIENGVNGFVSDNINELQRYISFLMDDEAAAKSVGLAGRQTAINLFGKATIKEQWRKFLDG
jgi:glycosyltransferase involved in cell wall biosynthesis